MKDSNDRATRALDLRHIGRIYDKEMPIDRAGMECAKPGLPDLRRRKFSVPVPEAERTPGPEDPPQTVR